MCAYGYKLTTHISGSKVDESPRRRCSSSLTGIVAAGSSADNTFLLS